MCLSAPDLCNGEVHCSDGSDEPVTCGGFKNYEYLLLMELPQMVEKTALLCVMLVYRKDLLAGQWWLQPRVCG